MWKNLCDELNLPHFEFIKVVGKGGVTGVNSEQEREKILAQKFKLDFSQLPAQRNIVIYDDAYRSGSTIDFVAVPLRQQGFNVVVIVDRIWKQVAEPRDLF